MPKCYIHHLPFGRWLCRWKWCPVCELWSLFEPFRDFLYVIDFGHPTSVVRKIEIATKKVSTLMKTSTMLLTCSVALNGDLYVAGNYTLFKMVNEQTVNNWWYPMVIKMGHLPMPKNTPTGLFVTQEGDLYIADLGNYRIRKVNSTTGMITTVAGNGTWQYQQDGVLATQTSLSTYGLVVLPSGNIIFSDTSTRIRKINKNSGMISTIAQNSQLKGNSNGDIASDPKISYTSSGVAISPLDGKIYLAMIQNIMVLTPSCGSSSPLFSYSYTLDSCVRNGNVTSSKVVNGGSNFGRNNNESVLKMGLIITMVIVVMILISSNTLWSSINY
ncbi:hypothetical protein C9374_004191 [Naegleria lovaniensis]|uniref:NHL repeat-containing protein n=1 Tax=Naegleria lovaniensis TaxID=51637 RepID=A0AA88GSX1_NAELO|nr:uncharacterized protein C9374_004191 [Naegleria lovaniensis]KAG2383520.1 hypothetical protein C9374_004191 [Naegleria lovaniensis]